MPGTKLENTVTFLDDNDGHDHPVYTQDTGHDHWHNRLHDQLGFEDTHGADAYTSLGRAVGSPQVREH